MKVTIARFLPNGLKAIVRPVYRKLFQGVGVEKATNLTIRAFDGFHIAFREGTTDEIIIGNRDSFRLPTLLPSYDIKDNHVIINIGAHIGVFALIASSAVPRGKVYAIEACKETFNFLRINAALNKANNISIHQIAIADKNGACTLYHDTRHWGHSITKQLSTHLEIVDGLTLEEFLSENEIKRCNFLYLNCEGAEFPILLSASPRALEKVDIILTDCHTHLWVKNTIEDLLLHLRAHGFYARLVRNEGTYDRILAVNTALHV
jgi:FkbM family methyltransferase